MSPTILMIVAFIGVAGMAAAVMSLFKSEGSTKAEDRLDVLAGRKKPKADEKITRDELFREGVSGAAGIVQNLLTSAGALKRLFEESQCPLSPMQFVVLMGGCSAFFGMVAAVAGAPIQVFVPVSLIATFFPIVWLKFRRGRRFKKFAADLPEALSLVARALRSGSSLAAGLKAVVDEMEGPVAEEFGIAYEQQNFGIPIEQCLKDLYVRLPNMDFKFFATAVSVQKQAGGDLSEVLDKISSLIRERFRIQGQVKALTGEGRISGVMLIGLPIVLFIAVLYLNPDYVMTLFTEPLGNKMLIAAVFLQVLGAVCIKKMVDIKI